MAYAHIEEGGDTPQQLFTVRLDDDDAAEFDG